MLKYSCAESRVKVLKGIGLDGQDYGMAMNSLQVYTKCVCVCTVGRDTLTIIHCLYTKLF